MMSRSYAAFILFLSLAGASQARAACTFRMDVLDVGQGDATFIQTPDCKTALIDGGDSGSGSIIRSHLASLGVSALDLVVVSHYHQDHLAGIVEIAQGTPIPVTTVIDHGGSYSSSTFSTYSQLYAGKRKTAEAGDVVALGSQVSLRVVSSAANGLTASDENSLSVGLKLTYGQLDVLLAGDLTGTGTGTSTVDLEGRIAPTVGPVEIYHVDHHGGSDSSNGTLLSLLQPDVSLISVGYDNTYGHPAADTLDRLDEVGSAVYMTEDPAQHRTLGSITVTSKDGMSYTVSQAGSSSTFKTRAAASNAVQVPASVAVYRGTSVSSSVTPLGSDDGSSWQATASSKSGSYQTDWSAAVNLGSTAKPLTMTVVLNGHYSTTRDQTVSLYVPSTGAWEALGTASIGSGDTTVRYTVSSPSRYLSSGKVQVRVTANSRSSSYKIYADALFVEWEP
jgi:beta-lactamase superfamily II metal-dependent hydrolase